MAKRSEAIDILKLYAEKDAKEWNAFLTTALREQNVSGLVDVLRRLQMGMDNLVAQKLNTEKVCTLFIRLQRSVENTIRDIHRRQNPNPLFITSDKVLHGDHLAEKKAKQQELERFMRKVRF